MYADEGLSLSLHILEWQVRRIQSLKIILKLFPASHCPDHVVGTHTVSAFSVLHTSCASNAFQHFQMI